MMTIAIYGSRRLQPWLGYIRTFMEQLRGQGASVVLHSKIHSFLREADPSLTVGTTTVSDGEAFDADLAVSLGGDGTMLRAAVWIGARRIPLIGFNGGHLGFLTAEPIEQLPMLLPRLSQDGFFTIERRTMLEVTGVELPAWCAPYALNEVALGKVESSSMITARVSIDGVHLADYRADGLIICTATGSTAYNLSVGGPIVQPTMDVCVLSPVAAHSLSMRPMVVDAGADIAVTTQARASHVRLSLDSRSLDIETGSTVAIRKAPFTLRLLRRADTSFADRLRDKLHWGEA